MGSKSEVGHLKNLTNPGNESITMEKLLDTNNRLKLQYEKNNEIVPEFKVAISGQDTPDNAPTTFNNTPINTNISIYLAKNKHASPSKSNTFGLLIKIK